jgi:hypothetical protein
MIGDNNDDSSSSDDFSSEPEEDVSSKEEMNLRQPRSHDGGTSKSEKNDGDISDVDDGNTANDTFD